MGNSGWSNDAIETLTVPTGAVSGQRVVIANQSNGDAVDVYDAGNNLIFSINHVGVATSHNPTTGIESSLQTGQIQLDDSPGTTNANLVLVPAADAAHQAALEIIASPPVGASYTLSLEGQSDDGSHGATLVGTERNVQGSMVQSDQHSTNNLIHAGSYSGTTDAAGHLIFNHGCAFTPTGAVATGLAPAVGLFPNLTFGTDGFTGTQANLSCIVANTGAAYANQPVMFNVVFFG